MTKLRKADLLAMIGQLKDRTEAQEDRINLLSRRIGELESRALMQQGLRIEPYSPPHGSNGDPIPERWRNICTTHVPNTSGRCTNCGMLLPL